MASFFGFTKDEVRMLAERHDMDFADLEKWYDGLPDWRRAVDVQSQLRDAGR